MPAPRKKKVDIQIRPMRLDDLAPVYALGERLFRAGDAPNLYRTWTDYVLVDSFSADREYCLIAEKDGEIVGFVLGYIFTKRKNTWTYGYLEWLGVAPEVGRMGVASRLISDLTSLFEEDGVRMMIVDTEAENEQAVNLFKKQGFGHPVEHVFLTRSLKKPAKKPVVRSRPTKTVLKGISL